MLYNEVFGCHGNTCYVILIDVYFCMIHSIGPINVCTDLLLIKMDKYNSNSSPLFCMLSKVTPKLKYLFNSMFLIASDTNIKSIPLCVPYRGKTHKHCIWSKIRQ